MLSAAPECCRRRRRTGVQHRHLVLVLVLVLTGPVVSLRGPEDDWRGPQDSGKTTVRVSYRSGKNDLPGGLMAMGGPQNLAFKDHTHIFPTTYRPRKPLHPSPVTPDTFPPSHRFSSPKRPHPHPPFSPTHPKSPPQFHSSIKTPPYSSNTTSKPITLPRLSPTPVQEPKEPPTRTSQQNPRALPPAAHSTPDAPKMKAVKDIDGGAGVGNSVMGTANATRSSSAKGKSGHDLRLRLRQTASASRVRLRPRKVEVRAKAMKRKGLGFSKRVSRRRAAYPGRLLRDSRRSFTPGPPYDHYRRMVHVPLGAPTTLAPLPPTLHTLPQPPPLPTKSTHSKNSLRGRLFPKKVLPETTPSLVPFYREDKHHGHPLLFTPPPPPPPLPPPPHHHHPHRSYQFPRPRPHPSITPSTPPPVLSFPFSTPSPQTPSSSPSVTFFRPVHHVPPSRPANSAKPPAVSGLGRSSTPRPLVHPRPSVLASPPSPPPTRAPVLTTTSSPSWTSSGDRKEPKKPAHPIYASVPVTSFTCRATPRPGLYGDVETGCQAWHVCEADGRQHSFLCPNGTVFSQRLLTCDWWFNVRCGSDDPHLASSIHTRRSGRSSDGYKDQAVLYGRKMTQELIKPHSPNHKVLATSGEEREPPGPAGATHGQPQQGQLPSPHFRGFHHGGTFPRFQLWGKHKT